MNAGSFFRTGFILAVLFVTTSMAYATGPVTSAASVYVCSGTTTVDIPITVSNFSGVGSIALKLTYNNSQITSPSLVPGSLAAGIDAWGTWSMNTTVAGSVTLSAYGQLPSDGVTLSNGSVLFSLRFSILPSATFGSLSFVENAQGTTCEYAGVAPDYPVFPDTPASSYYIPGGVTINPSPEDLTVIANPDLINPGTTTSIYVFESVAGTMYQLRNNAGNTLVGMASSGTGGLLTLSTGPLYTATTFNVLATLGSCTRQMSQTPKVTVQTAPMPSILGPSVVCANSTNIGYITTSVPGHLYLWSVEGAVSFTGQGTSQIIVNWGAGSGGTVSVTEFEQSTGNSGSATLPVTINPTPTLVISGPATVQPGGSGTYSTTINGAYAYSWNVTGAASFSGQGSSSINVVWGSPGSGTVSVSVTNILTGCSGSSTPLAVSIATANKISGFFSYYNLDGTPLDNVSLVLKSGSTTVKTTTTDANGFYQFTMVSPGTYTIQATTTKPVGGINTTDASAINTWWVAANMIERVKWNAGDANNSNMINASDAGAVQANFVYGLPFNRGTWTFAKQPDASFFNPPSASNENIIVTGSDVTRNYYGLCVGDFNRSYRPPSGKSSGNETSRLTLGYSSSIISGPDNEIDLPVTVNSGMQVGAVSLILSYPEDLVQIRDVVLSDGSDPAGNAQNLSFHASGGELRVGWTSTEPMDLQEGTTLITLRLKTSSDFVSGTSIRIALAQSSLNELSDGFSVPLEHAVLSTVVIKSSPTGIPEQGATSVSLENHPNPFAGTTVISYQLQSDGDVLLEIFDIVGGKINTLLNCPEHKGRHELKLSAEDLNPGIYTARLKFTTSNTTLYRTIKLIHTR